MEKGEEKERKEETNIHRKLGGGKHLLRRSCHQGFAIRKKAGFARTLEFVGLWHWSHCTSAHLGMVPLLLMLMYFYLLCGFYSVLLQQGGVSGMGQEVRDQ